MAYLDIYCLDADGSLFDAALLSAAAAFSHCEVSGSQLVPNMIYFCVIWYMLCLWQ
uniref:Uncharacterized protein n=1 Tax=Cucumis sativus TaxID=3659 RepID=A0A0A0KWB3_CUCSA